MAQPVQYTRVKMECLFLGSRYFVLRVNYHLIQAEVERDSH